MRWADLGPTPGNLPSSSIRFWTALSYTQTPCARHLAGGYCLKQEEGLALVEGLFVNDLAAENLLDRPLANKDG